MGEQIMKPPRKCPDCGKFMDVQRLTNLTVFRCFSCGKVIEQKHLGVQRKKGW